MAAGLTGSGDVLVGKSGTKSHVWNYFGLIADENGRGTDENRPICKVCRLAVRAKSGNTSNLLSHLKNKHPKEYKDMKQLMDSSDESRRRQTSAPTPSNQQTLKQVIHKSQEYERNGKQWTRLTAAVTRCIAKDALPIYSVEKEGFKNMLKEFDGRYVLPSRSYFSRTAIPNLYTSIREIVSREVQNALYFSVTTDMWSSFGLNPYISFTVHFIDQNWQLRSRALQTEFLPVDHTGDNIAEALTGIRLSWNLSPDRQACLTTDNGSNIICAARKLDWVRLSCFGHNLNLAIRKSMDDVRCSRALGISRKVVSTFSMSWKRRRDLLEAQIALNLRQKCLVADCPTRWGSMNKMVSRLLEQEEAVRRVLSSDRKTSHLILTWQDIDVLKSIDKVLSQLTSLTDALSGENYVTVSFLLPLLDLLNNSILKEEDDDTDLTKRIKTTIKGDLATRYQDEKTIELLQIASILDPRFKAKYINNLRLDELKLLIISEGITLMAEECPQALHQSTESSLSNPSTSQSSTSPPPSKRKRIVKNLGTLFKDKEQEQSVCEIQSRTPEDEITNELQTYLSIPMLDAEDEPLPWWQENQRKYPMLSKMARKYLCVCATSSSSERLFSTAGHVVTRLRAHLNPDKVDMLVFLSKNL